MRGFTTFGFGVGLYAFIAAGSSSQEQAERQAAQLGAWAAWSAWMPHIDPGVGFGGLGAIAVLVVAVSVGVARPDGASACDLLVSSDGVRGGQ
jgi:hypothetical protein